MSSRFSQRGAAGRSSLSVGLAAVMLAAVCACDQGTVRVAPTLPSLSPPTNTISIQEPVVTVKAAATALPRPSSTAKPTAIEAPKPTPLATATRLLMPHPNRESVVVPILMYHHLRVLDPEATELQRTWTVSPEQFAAQLDYIQARGFNTITIAQLVGFFEDGAPLPEHPIILTFDDAWLEQYSTAFRELARRGMVGVFFAPTSYVTAGGRTFYNWDQAIEMDRAGMELGGHTINHPDLRKEPPEEVRRQLFESKRTMEEKLGHPTISFSYPFGAFDSFVVEQTKAVGYRAAVILCCGYEQSAEKLFVMPRIRVSYEDSVKTLAVRLP